MADQRSIGPVQEQPGLNEQTRRALTVIKDFDPDLAARALAIMAGRPAKAPLTIDRAIAAALHEQKTGLVEGRDFYIDQYMGLVAGYRGLQRETNGHSGEYLTNYRPFTAEENADHEVQPGDLARVCELSQLDTWAKCRAMGVRYHPILGYGILRKGERLNNEGKLIQLKGGYTWERKAQTRAYKDALRHTPNARASTAEILTDAASDGLDIDLPDGAIISRDQAEQFVTEAQERQGQPAERPTPEQAQAILARANAERDQAQGDFEALEGAPDSAHPPTATTPSGIKPESLDRIIEKTGTELDRLAGGPERVASLARNAIPLFTENGKHLLATHPAVYTCGHDLLVVACDVGFEWLTLNNLPAAFEALEARALSLEADEAMKAQAKAVPA